MWQRSLPSKCPSTNPFPVSNNLNLKNLSEDELLLSKAIKMFIYVKFV
jgi:hypothetical protein